MHDGTGQKLYERAKQRIPGGSQLLSKKPERFLPGRWPAYFSRVKGCEVWDMDGNHFYDFSHNGIGTCVLGAGDPDVDAAVLDAIEKGTMSTLNCPEEVDLADLLCELHPWADMARFCRTGGEAMAVAVRIARASTKRETIAFCGYHGWHDWYLSANIGQEQLGGHLRAGLDPVGVPPSLEGTTYSFHYNRLEQLEEIVSRHGKDLAAIVMEPIRGEKPTAEFLAGVRALADETGAVLILDECSAGFRLNCGGAHLLLGLEPDIAMFAKAMSNGYPMAAVIGKGTFMKAAEQCFISSTYWTERIGPVAALATIRKFRDREVHRHLVKMGAEVQSIWAQAAEAAGLSVVVGGIEPLSHFDVDHPEGNAARTVYTGMMLERGYLASESFYPTFAHTSDQVTAFSKECGEVFREIRNHMDSGSLQSAAGEVALQGFKRTVS